MERWLYPPLRRGGNCFVCDKPYSRDEKVWWIKTDTENKACHEACKSGATVMQMQSFLFTTSDRTSLFDQLELDPKDMLVKAFEISAREKQTVAVARKEDDKWTAVMMISAVTDSLYPKPKPAPVSITAKPGEPLFPWTDETAPF